MAEVASDDSYRRIFGILGGEVRRRISVTGKKDRIRLNPRPTKEPTNASFFWSLPRPRTVSLIWNLWSQRELGNTVSIRIPQTAPMQSKQREPPCNLSSNLLLLFSQCLHRMYMFLLTRAILSQIRPSIYPELDELLSHSFVPSL